jgi:hypothetical protein
MPMAKNQTGKYAARAPSFIPTAPKSQTAIQQIEDHEKFARPGDESEEFRRADIKVGDVFFREMEALKGDPD